MDTFLPRHIGTVGTEVEEMCKTVGVRDLDDLVDKTVPQAIRLQDRLKLDEPLTESEALEKLRGIMNKNKVAYMANCCYFFDYKVVAQYVL